MTARLIRPSDPVVIPPLVALIYGDPGVGKTSSATTADAPILFAYDRGYHRSKSRALGVPSVEFDTWADCIAFTRPENLTEYNTIILDTVGSLVDLLSAHLVGTSSKNARGDGSLSLQGYGALATAFEAFVATVRALGKTLVMVAHAKEDKDGDETRKRPDIRGSARDTVCKVADVVGYAAAGDRGERLIHWDPSARWYAKSPALGTTRVPDIVGPSLWLADLLAGVRATFGKVAEESGEIAKVVMAVQATLAACDTDTQLTEIALGISAKKPSPSLGAQLRRLVADRAKELELAWDKKANRYVAAVEASAS